MNRLRPALARLLLAPGLLLWLAAAEAPAPPPPAGLPPTTGSITGRVKFDGPAPARAALQPHHDAHICTEPLLSEEVIVSQTGGLANVALILEGEGLPPPGAKPRGGSLDQKGCTFVPHVQTLTVGSDLDVGNDDGTLHNVHALTGGRTVFNLGMAVKGLRIKRKMAQPGVVKIRCDSGHSWMRAWLIVVPHELHATSDLDGGFQIEGVPPGTWKVTAWHEKLGQLQGTVTVTAGAGATLALTFPASSLEAPMGGESIAAVDARIAKLEVSLAEKIETARREIASLDKRVIADRRARFVSEGRPLYDAYCGACHGAKGDGKGVQARFLAIPPRDFTKGDYRIRTTPTGALPREEDLVRTIRAGLLGTPMPGWGGVLTTAEQATLARFLTTFSERFANPEPLEVIEVPAAPPADAAALARGKELYGMFACAACHGPEGRGDGVAAEALTDDAGNKIRPADFTRGFVKGGRGPEPIYRAISTGLSGTPMPAFGAMLQPNQRWDLAHYVVSLGEEKGPIDWLLLDPAGRSTVP